MTPKCGDELSTVIGRAVICRLEEWGDGSLRKFRKDKCNVLHLRRNNTWLHHWPGAAWMGSSTAEKTGACSARTQDGFGRATSSGPFLPVKDLFRIWSQALLSST